MIWPAALPMWTLLVPSPRDEMLTITSFTGHDAADDQMPVESFQGISRRHLSRPALRHHRGERVFQPAGRRPSGTSTGCRLRSRPGCGDRRSDCLDCFIRITVVELSNVFSPPRGQRFKSHSTQSNRCSSRVVGLWIRFSKALQDIADAQGCRLSSART